MRFENRPQKAPVASTRNQIRGMLRLQNWVA